MAGKQTGGIGTGNRISRAKSDSKQTKITTEERDGGKRVTKSNLREERMKRRKRRWKNLERL